MTARRYRTRISHVRGKWRHAFTLWQLDQLAEPDAASRGPERDHRNRARAGVFNSGKRARYFQASVSWGQLDGEAQHVRGGSWEFSPEINGPIVVRGLRIHRRSVRASVTFVVAGRHLIYEGAPHPHRTVLFRPVLLLPDMSIHVEAVSISDRRGVFRARFLTQAVADRRMLPEERGYRWVP